MQTLTSSKHQIKIKLKKGDEVKVLTGKSKGTSGVVEKVDRKKLRVTVSGVNIARIHKKPSVNDPQGGIIEVAKPIHVSNVAFLDPKTKKPSRLGYKIEDGKKVRISKSSGSVV